MGRKVFISFLGTNNYLQTRYILGEKKSPAVRFVQQALIGFLCEKWTEEDCVMIFYTKEACKRNWEDGGQGNNVSEIEKMGLCSSLKRMNLRMKIEDYEIAEGFSEEDIWSIFDCIYDKLQENDLIYFDVTHAFRSIPLFSTVLFNYARFMKNTKLVSIYYGAFEKMGPAFKVKEEIPNPDDREAPIVDLTSLAELQTTNIAAGNFMEFGKVGTIAEQLNAVADSDTKSSKTLEAIRILKKELANLDDYILTCRMDKIKQGTYIKNIKERFNVVMQSGQLRNSEKLLLKKIEANLELFESRVTENNIHAAVEWALQYGMLQQAYTLGQEYIISKTGNLLMEKQEYAGLVDAYRQNRGGLMGYVRGILGIAENDITVREKYKDELGKHQDETYALLRQEWIIELRREYNILRINRNILNHAKRSDKNTALFRQEFDIAYHNCIEKLKNI